MDSCVRAMFRSFVVVGLLVLGAGVCMAQKDPGMRQGPPGAGNPLTGLTPIELQMFLEGLNRALQLEAVCDTCSDITLDERSVSAGHR